MSNQVYVQSCIFIDVPAPIKDDYTDAELTINYGFRIYDDEGKDYDTNFNKESWKNMRQSGIESILNYFADFGGNEGAAIAEFALQSRKCAYFDGVWTALTDYWDQAQKAPKDEEEIE